MKHLALSAVFLLIVASRAAAEPGRYDALKSLVGALPEKNPSEDSGYMDVFGFNVPDQIKGCHWKADEMDSIERILALFAKYTDGLSVNKKQLIEALGQLPDFADRNTDKSAMSNYNSLVMGIRLAPDMTKASLTNADCRALLKMQFENGASRAVLSDIVEKSKADLEAAPAPR